MASKDLFNFKILTPSGRFIEGLVSQVQVTSYEGKLGVMANHEPMVVACPPGVMSICQDGEWTRFAISRAILTVDESGTTLLTALAKLSI